GEEGPHHHQAAVARRAGHPGPARRPCARPARHQHHGVLQGVQRADPGGRRHGHPRRHHGLRGSLVHLRHQDAARGGADQAGHRAGEGLGRAAHEEGGHDHARPDPRDRREEARRPQRQRRRPGGEDHRRHRPLHGRHGRGL
ncbi:MAG: LSU ribosomal protein L11p (L12e), partial [uncultured Phycisphaerae bacterium]